jgi:predicted dehydrogenase
MSRQALRVALVGCGLIGRKRAEALGTDRLVGCFDIDLAAAGRLAADHGAAVCASLEELLGLDADVVVVATVHNKLAALACEALAAGRHVLVEKPAGAGLRDVEAIQEAARRAGRLVKVGLNHRFHPGIERAVTEARSGRHGAVMFARGRYGHGGRLGYEKEWRADPAVSGGGEIIDQGMHLLDLSHWLLGALPLDHALLRTHFWDAPVDDNAVLLLGERGGVGDRSPWALFHVSWTEWKNMFSLEIYCERAKLAVSGLTRSYGPQELWIYTMRPELGPPDVEHVRYPDRDVSWEREWRHFSAALRSGGGAPLLGDLDSAAYAWRCVEQATR